MGLSGRFGERICTRKARASVVLLVTFDEVHIYTSA
ncbi:unnamed protein product [Amoebophrya sp. A25]|nr:unnamed protein product [Amoebophrya sp. A25]|eukprot:GSA25T00020019001.1